MFLLYHFYILCQLKHKLNTPDIYRGYLILLISMSSNYLLNTLYKTNITITVKRKIKKDSANLTPERARAAVA